MINHLCTPVINDQYSILRHFPLQSSNSSQPTIVPVTGSVVGGNYYTCTIPTDALIAHIIARTNYIFTVGPSLPNDDATICWMHITNKINELETSISRTGGTVIVVSRAMFNYLAPYQTLSKVIWIVDESVGLDKLLITYHGFQPADGGYPCRDNKDGTVTLYEVHPLDSYYYRTVYIDPPISTLQHVRLNWYR